MTLANQIKNAIKIEPKNGSVLLKINWGYAFSFERVWLGLNDKVPVEKKKKIFPDAKGFEFYDIPEKMKKEFSFGIGKAQSKRDL